MINKVMLNGRMTADIEMRKTTTGKDVGSFRIAVNRNVKGQDGKKEADFINCVAWGNTAVAIQKYSGKGMLLSVDGRLQIRSYQNQQGQTVYVTEVVAENVDILEWKKQDQPMQQSNYQQQYQQPQPQYAGSLTAQAEMQSAGIDYDEDLPF